MCLYSWSRIYSDRLWHSGAIAPVAPDWITKHGGLMISKELIRNADKAAEFLTLLGNSKRLAIMSHLLEGELSVGAIAEKVSLSQSALSQHLAKLRSLDLVQTRRDRQMIYYSCKSIAVRRLFLTLDDIFGDTEEEKPARRALAAVRS